MALVNMLCTIPFPCSSLEEAQLRQRTMEDSGIIVATRQDRIQLVQAHPEDFSDNKWYVVIHTGNLLGMVHDLTDEGFL